MGPSVGPLLGPRSRRRSHYLIGGELAQEAGQARGMVGGRGEVLDIGRSAQRPQAVVELETACCIEVARQAASDPLQGGDLGRHTGRVLGSCVNSQQLSVLRRAGLVTTRKEGASVIYAIRDRELVKVLAAARRVLINSLADSEDLLADLRSANAG